jgi:hypothetical protein
LGFVQAIDQRLRELTEKIKIRPVNRLRERHLSSIVKEGLDQSLAREAFEQRFEEIRLREMRKSLPGLLPVNERPRFRDPEWDNLDDPVPGWVTLVHVFFMVWTIVMPITRRCLFPAYCFFSDFPRLQHRFKIGST